MNITAHLYRPTRGTRRAACLLVSHQPVYMAFQPTRFTHNTGHPTLPWALTSHFHPYPERIGAVHFLWHLLSSVNFLTKAFPLGSVALCVVRTFLPSFSWEAIERPAFIWYKDTQLLEGSSTLNVRPVWRFCKPRLTHPQWIILQLVD